jgi:hypothetical protein
LKIRNRQNISQTFLPIAQSCLFYSHLGKNTLLSVRAGGQLARKISKPKK